MKTQPNLTWVFLNNFSIFRDVRIQFSEGVNILIGKNGTGKTHLLKVLYAASESTNKGRVPFAEKLVRVFLPLEGRIGRLIKRQCGSSEARVAIKSKSRWLRLGFSNHTHNPSEAKQRQTKDWQELKFKSTYIPVKEMLAHAPGFRSLYSLHNISFEEVYPDIIDRAFRPPLRGPIDAPRKKLLVLIQKCIEGKVIQKEEHFFLRNKQGNLEFSLLAEGMRKLALLWLLIQNGSLSKGSILFWDEPEANLNPAMMRHVVAILLELQRLGVQVFLATHDYVLLKEFDLQTKDDDKISFHAFHTQEGDLKVDSTDSYLEIEPNAISETFLDLYDRDIERALKGNRD